MEREVVKKARALKIIHTLLEKYPDPHTALHHRNPLELLVATILSAQCTDKRVNIVTKALFEKYRSAEDYANADIDELISDISTINLYQNKARNIQKSCQLLLEKNGGQVPDSLEDLVTLPGVGRKTANVVLGDAFGKTGGIVVDTHVKRVAGRLALTDHSDPEKIERDLMRVVPREHWIGFSHLLIFHGRETCVARNPHCAECVVNTYCPSRRDKPYVGAG